MNPLKTLLRHSSHYFGGRLALMILGFASFPVFTRVFSVADYGTLNLIQNTVLLLTVLGKFGLQHALQRFYPEHVASADPLSLRRYYSTLFYGSGLLGGVFSSVFLGAVVMGLGRFLGISVTSTLALATFLVVIRSLRSMQLNLMQMENKTKLFNGMEIVQKAGAIGLTLLLLFLWSRSIVACFIALIVIEGMVMLQYVFILARRGLISLTLFDFKFFREAAAFSFPLMIAEIAWVLLAAGDRFFVQHYRGVEAVGYYAAAYGIATYVQEVLMVPLQISFFPICMKLWAAEGKEATQRFLSRSLNYFMIGAVLVVSVAIVTSQDVVVVLASKKFQQARSLLPFLVTGLVLWAANTFFRPGLLIHKRARTIAQTTLCAVALNIGLNIVLLPKLGLVGAAWASTISFVAMLVLTGFASLRVLSFRIEWLALVRYLAVGLLASWIASRIPIESPMPSALAKGTVILLLYGGVLWIVDGHTRQLFAQVISSAAQFARGRREVAAEPLTATVER
jgi:O-antigen/teichoic acid export membrane protein